MNAVVSFCPAHENKNLLVLLHFHLSSSSYFFFPNFHVDLCVQRLNFRNIRSKQTRIEDSPFSTTLHVCLCLYLLWNNNGLAIRLNVFESQHLPLSLQTFLPCGFYFSFILFSYCLQRIKQYFIRTEKWKQQKQTNKVKDKCINITSTIILFSREFLRITNKNLESIFECNCFTHTRIHALHYNLISSNDD